MGQRLKVKGLNICYSAAYMSQTQEQQRFTISRVAADWHELVIPQHIMWPSVASANSVTVLLDTDETREISMCVEE